MRIYKMPGFSTLERKLEFRHAKTCANDCSEGMVHRRGKPQKWEKFCNYMPLGCQQDIRCFYLSAKGRTTLREVEVEAPKDK